MDSATSIVGNMARDPELRYTNSGKAVTGFAVAVSTRVKGDDGQWKSGDPSFFEVVCWNLLAESVAETLKKGDRVVVVGRLRQESYEKDGQKRSTVKIVADEVARSVLFDSYSKDGARPQPLAAVGSADEPF